MAVNLNRMRDCLTQFDFHRLFIEELGWSQPAGRQTISFIIKDAAFSRRQIAQLAGVAVFEVGSADGLIPDAKVRAEIHKEISKHYHENLLVFVDAKRSQSLWYWVKRRNGKVFPRDHHYFLGQPGDLFLSKLNAMVFDIGDFDDEGHVPILKVTDRLKEALDVERVTKKFYTEFQDQHLAFLELIGGIDDERDRRWYASVLLNRLMFIYFLQRKFFLDHGDGRYLQNKLTELREIGRDLYYERFLKVLFFEGFAKPEDKRGPGANKLLGKIKYLNGGLFLLHPVEQRWPDISVPDGAFENLYSLFERYSWNLNDTPCGEDNEINPDVLGYIFEKYINQKAFGAFYTRPEITEYLCERTIHRLILEGVNSPGIPGVLPPRRFDDIGDLLINLDATLCRKLLYEVLPNLRLLDPACGSAAFLVAAMKTLINIYAAVVGRIEFLNDINLKQWLEEIKKRHPSVGYFIKKTIITDNLFGVDIMEEAVEIAKLRLFLALVAAANSEDELEPLPNIDFNILPGNSLIGLMHVEDEEFERRHPPELFRKSYREVLAETHRLIGTYRHTATYAEDLRALRDRIAVQKQDAVKTLNAILLDEFAHLGIKYEQAVWDEKKNAEGKSKKRLLEIRDIEALKPFHWGFEFDEIINRRGGFDAIITNPPWEVFQTNEKEFFQEFESTIAKKKLRIEDWEKQIKYLMQDSELRSAWLQYASNYPHQWEWFKQSSQYRNQIVSIDGKAVGNKPNLYNLFSEQCFNLLRDGGYCGIVIPSGIYTDLGAKQLREMLFSQTKVTSLFCFENRKAIFEGVDSRFKFVVLSFEKGGRTDVFPAAFMRHDVEELDRFPTEGSIGINIDTTRKLSPISLSIPEFKSSMDVAITTKNLDIPFLKDSEKGWELDLYGEELNMTRSASYFKTTKTPWPVFEGGMIWHFDSHYSKPRYWIEETDLRKTFAEKRAKRIKFPDHLPNDIKNDYETYRLAIRKIASNTNERTLVSTIIPPGSFAGNSLSVHFPFKNEPAHYNNLKFSLAQLLALTSLLNSFVADWILRARMTTNLNLFYLYQLPVPRLTEEDAAFRPIVRRAARLICTTPEFDDLAKKVGLGSHKDGATDPVERGKLRAELDGLIAHLYHLTEEEFAYILTTFPLVSDSVKIAAHNAYRNVEKGLIQ